MTGRIEITKNYVGRVVYGYPTGNNAVRGRDKQDLVELPVVGFGIKYAKVIRYGKEIAICPKSGATQAAIKSGFSTNAGFMFFESPDDAYNYVNLAKIRSLVASSINHRTIELLDDDLVYIIASELGICA